MCSGTAERTLELPESALVTTDELHLDLAETTHDPPSFEDRDRVLDDLRTVPKDGLTPSAKTRDLHEGLAVSKMHDQELCHLGRWLRRRSGNLELDPGGTRRDLELPQPSAVLDTVAKRYPASRESKVSCVVVRRREYARRRRLAEVREPEALVGNQLDLAFDGLAHGVSE